MSATFRPRSVVDGIQPTVPKFVPVGGRGLAVGYTRGAGKTPIGRQAAPPTTLPIQQLAVHLQNTVTHFQLASGSMNAIAAAPPPNLGGTPQWALDMIHENKWEFYVMKIMNYNSSVDLQLEGQVAWSLARNQNATLTGNSDVLHFAPLYLPWPRFAIPAIPAPPAPGAPANPPPVFALPAAPAPAAHASFPATLGDLRTLTLADLALLFPAYNIPQPHGLVGVQRAEFARHIGVSL
ncbi:hypothetical protein B0H17DRAFT_1342251 [Mycena rosella]|uniref:Uncharacterized protein n=1 Tax=Mycena rosella TaxID=1033263 RepID=A0AAD7AY27_MYCRO|nr:hypothetical protein B0H17DRAFT_1342251 [Mycena rosella]